MPIIFWITASKPKHTTSTLASTSTAPIITKKGLDRFTVTSGLVADLLIAISSSMKRTMIKARIVPTNNPIIPWINASTPEAQHRKQQHRAQNDQEGLGSVHSLLGLSDGLADCHLLVDEALVAAGCGHDEGARNPRGSRR